MAENFFNIGYITQQIPYGKVETFLISEMEEVAKLCKLIIIPLRPEKEIFHREAMKLKHITIKEPLISLKYAVPSVINLFQKACIISFLVRKIVLESESFKIKLKNFIVLPKSIHIAGIIKKLNIKHIHAHWASTSTSAAWIISKLTDIPFSFTAHRWDIMENNMLREKVKSAKFVRCVSRSGEQELLHIVGEKYREKIKVIHMGTIILKNKNFLRPVPCRNRFTILTPANLYEVKGHRYLVEACSILDKRGIKNFKCIFYGEGPEKAKLKREIERKSLNNYIEMPGRIAHDKLMEIYRSKETDVVILPSINTKDGEHEGIPVSLMEAMSYKIPVISTNTGGLPELLSGGAGVLVKEKDPEQLAWAIKKLMKDNQIRKDAIERGYKRMQEEFDIQKNAKKLVELIRL